MPICKITAGPHRTLRRWLFLAMLLWPSQALAVTFANYFVRFEMPARWRCDLEALTWVCQSWDAAHERDGLIVFAAKQAGDIDSLEQYQAYLRQPRQYTNPDGKLVTSTVLAVQRRWLRGVEWIDGLHDDSEIAGFRTRYLATVKDGLGVLITYSIRGERYKSYESDFEQLVQSLKVKSPLSK